MYSSASDEPKLNTGHCVA